MAQEMKYPKSPQEFLEVYNSLDAESQRKIYDALVKLGLIEPSPEIEALEKRLKEELRLAEEAEKRAEEAKKELERLRNEIKQMKGKNPRNAGRKANDEKFTESFNKFVALYEAHKPTYEIMEKVGISKRTYYRYKKLYQEKMRGI